jgi:sugar fermentation stimulation protein A
VEVFAPAREIDPAYAGALENAVKQGVEVLVYVADVSPQQIVFGRKLPVEI